MNNLSLSSFLQIQDIKNQGNPNFVSATYQFSERIGKSRSHCLWWPCTNSQPKTILLFVPGNPGLADFYTSYLSHVHNSSTSPTAILALSHIGLSSSVEPVPLAFSSLQAQVAGVIECVESLRETFDSTFSLVLIGHSVGAWIVLQALKEIGNQVDKTFFLFPTITHILNTPNGRKLSWLFRHPIPSILSTLTNALRFLPKAAVRATLFGDWPPDQMSVLWSFLRNRHAVLASLTMAGEEMNTIKDLDIPLLEKLGDKLYFFFATEDNWVGANKEVIVKALSGEAHSIRIVNGRHGIPHAYCINHSVELGEQTLQWLNADNLTRTT